MIGEGVPFVGRKDFRDVLFSERNSLMTSDDRLDSEGRSQLILGSLKIFN